MRNTRVGALDARLRAGAWLWVVTQLPNLATIKASCVDKLRGVVYVTQNILKHVWFEPV